jgi:hypothetical protein
MKRIILFLMLLYVTNLSSQDNSWGETFKTVSSFKFQEGSIILEKKIDTGESRTNPDGTKFYKTTFAIRVESAENNESIRSVIETDAYTSANYDKGMTPCVLVDPDRNTVSIFTNSKATDPYYGMDGFVYRIDMNTKRWVKEIVFTQSNFGWFSFFGGSDNGNPELCHFSFAGYCSILSKRNSSGKWTSQNMGSIRPEQADKQYASHKNILFANRPNVDRMNLQDGNYASSSSSSSPSYISDKDLALAAGVAGTAAIFYGLYKLLTAGSSSGDSYGSYSGSSSSGSSSSSSSGSHSSSNSGSSSINPENVNIPGATRGSRISRTSEGRCDYRRYTFDDGITGYVYYPDGKYAISDAGAGYYYYATETDAKDALYVFKKYGKVRKTGKR